MNPVFASQMIVNGDCTEKMKKQMAFIIKKIYINKE